jgi:hypothetical protein
MAAIVNLFVPRRRLHRRVPLGVPVALVHECGTVGTAVGLNLSVSGVHVQCDRMTLDSLYRSDVPARLVQSFLDAHFMLPVFSVEAKIDARCSVVYRQTIADDVHVLGLEFLSLPESSRLQVLRYVNEVPTDADD